jgi:hypothetical protein
MHGITSQKAVILTAVVTFHKYLSIIAYYINEETNSVHYLIARRRSLLIPRGLY